MKSTIAEIKSVMAASKRQFLAKILKPGETYSGILLGENGAPDEHLIVMAPEIENADWDKAMAFAKSIGGELPSRREFRLLYANAKSAFKPVWHWSREQLEHGPANAWLQDFGNGGQNDFRKSYAGSARAVRRLPI